MKINGVATIQHYVPQCILRNFKSGKKDQIYVLDKIRKKIYLSNIKNVASERYFYNIEIDEEAITLEDYFGTKVEPKINNILNRISENKNLNVLSTDEKIFLSEYICIQYLRTKSHRESVKDLIMKMVEKLKGFGIPEVKNFSFDDVNTRVAQITTMNLLTLSKELLPCMLDKKWFLLNSFDAGFCIGDAPIVLRNYTINPVFGDPDIGFGSKGIEIYFPISPNLCIAAICSSHMEKLEKARSFPNYDKPGMTILGAIELGSYFNVTKSYEQYLNRLQFNLSEQFLFSQSESELKEYLNLVLSNSEVIGQKRFKFY